MAEPVVNPYKVEGTIDYVALAREFGLKLIDGEIEKRIEKYTGPLHFLLKRHIFYAHRDLDWVLDEYEKGNPFYLYTGIAPSGSMTIAHLLPFLFNKWLQDRFGAEIYIQIPDEEKALVRGLGFEEVHKLAYEDALDIIALGFKPSKTRIFFDTEYAKVLYPQAVRVAKHITFSMVKDAFGFTNENNIGSIFYTSMQAVPAILKSVQAGKNVPCLIPCGVDQDVHFRLARDAIAKLGYYKPAGLYSVLMPGLGGKGKMSTSNPNDTIYLRDTPDAVNKKIANAFTGQQATAALQRKRGGNPDICTICQYNRFFFEPDDRKLNRIIDGERNGTILAGEHKADLAKKVNAFLRRHRGKRELYRKKLDDFIVRG